MPPSSDTTQQTAQPLDTPTAAGLNVAQTREITVRDCRAELNEINARHGAGLGFMRQEFDRLERELVPDDLSDEAAVTRHGRLVYFIQHLVQTTSQLHELEGLVGDAETLLASSFDRIGGDGLDTNVEWELFILVGAIRSPLQTPPPHRGVPAPNQSAARGAALRRDGKSPPMPAALGAVPAAQPPQPPLTVQQQQAQLHTRTPPTAQQQQQEQGSAPKQYAPVAQYPQQPPPPATSSPATPEFSGERVASPETAMQPPNGHHTAVSTEPNFSVFSASSSSLSVLSPPPGDAHVRVDGGSGLPLPAFGFMGGEQPLPLPPPSAAAVNLGAVKREFDVDSAGGLDDLGEWEMGVAALGNVDDAVAGALSLANGHRHTNLTSASTSSARGAVNVNGGWWAPNGRKRVRGGFEDDDTKAMEALTAPKPVEYQCSVCAESYPSSSNLNPWWAITKEMCPKCDKEQIPRIDISEPANTIEYHPALLRASAAENGGGGGIIGESDLLLAGADSGGGGGAGGDDMGAHAAKSGCLGGLSLGGGGANGRGSNPDDDGGVEEDEVELGADGMLGDGEHRLPTSQAAKLLVLIAHARTCPGRHLSRSHSEVCKSVKYLMLHIRDCCGNLPDGSECGFPWCRPCKCLIHHLVKCQKPEKCPVCSPVDLPPALSNLRSLNQLHEGGGSASSSSSCCGGASAGGGCAAGEAASSSTVSLNALS
eukprot:CAMPEP_0171867268 /NCGR_PEP_ID=MMETSP0992-20121227/30759_1 /TAXON_ID=483369 /ORGANISM="non described non described, Strain CCMP2098" /LENGTH=709 /DNA_ID=CAMNT_0012490813 /DNA_START=74 /DNA_END=2202 /DNA_ORIENTATION=+